MIVHALHGRHQIPQFADAREGLAQLEFPDDIEAAVLMRLLVASAALTETPHRPLGSHPRLAGSVAWSAR